MVAPSIGANLVTLCHEPTCLFLMAESWDQFVGGGATADRGANQAPPPKKKAWFTVSAEIFVYVFLSFLNRWMKQTFSLQFADALVR